MTDEQLDRYVAFAAEVVSLRFKNRKLREALEVSAHRLHDLADELEHSLHIFADCPHYACTDAREALHD